MDINNKILESALKIMTSPAVYGPDTPTLQTMEIFDKIKRVYRMGFEDGLKQKEANEIIKIATDAGD